MADNSTASAGAHVDYLDSSGFDEAIKAFETACNKYKDIKSSVERETASLLSVWEGEGAAQFEKDYRLIYQQLADILDWMYDLYNGLIEAQAAYLKTDQELSKQYTA